MMSYSIALLLYREECIVQDGVTRTPKCNVMYDAVYLAAWLRDVSRTRLESFALPMNRIFVRILIYLFTLPSSLEENERDSRDE
jgi:hypothetical protein